MTEIGSQPEPQPRSVPQPAAALDPPAPRRSRRRVQRITALALSAVVMAAAAVGAAVRMADAERTATSTHYWSAEVPGTPPSVPAPRGLAAALLPMPDTFWPGPDMDEYGDSAVVTGPRASVLMKDASRGLSLVERKEHHAAVDQLKLKGLAARSYRSRGADVIAEVRIAQMEPAMARKRAHLMRQLTGAFNDFRKGPKIEGHPEAVCHLFAKQVLEPFAGLTCSAYRGDLVVSYQAYGTAPFATEVASELLRQQLDHIKSPGEYV
ncbi:hypothetical protein [Streptomyces sp. NPDC006879]|uniref:hypothetical protein n=1 Tax=Streptomyces sp. NPDC006879 TaxID=3364767 RepID=UPI0036CACC14